MGHHYHFKRGDPVIIVSGRYKGCTGVVDSAVFQHTVDSPEEYRPGYHMVLDDGTLVTVGVEQVVRMS
jgi:ribosomal protein L24